MDTLIFLHTAFQFYAFPNRYLANPAILLYIAALQ